MREYLAPASPAAGGPGALPVTSSSASTSGRASASAVTVAAEHPVAVAGRLLVRYGLVVVVAWIGALKYTQYEATTIQPLIAHSPLMSWLYHLYSVRALGAALGSAEILAALLIALYPLRPRISAASSAF